MSSGMNLHGLPWRVVRLSYKFYWLLAIIDELEQRQKANKSLTDEMLLTDLAINMLSLALYPTVYFT